MIMRNFLLTAMAACLMQVSFAQTDSTLPRRTFLGADARANDHFMLQLGGTSWSNKPDSIHTSGFSRSFNMYLMLDFPFKTNPHLSVAIGPGIATDNMFFDKTSIGIKESTTSIRFRNVADTNYFKKYKLSTAYLEAPVELRYRFNPENDAKSIKIAIGAKIGTLLNAHVKGKTLKNKSGSTIGGYTEKESSKAFFNQNRLSLTARAGYGHFTIFGSYAASTLFKEGQGPQVHPVTVGLAFSGL